MDALKTAQQPRIVGTMFRYNVRTHSKVGTLSAAATEVLVVLAARRRYYILYGSRPVPKVTEAVDTRIPLRDANEDLIELTWNQYYRADYVLARPASPSSLATPGTRDSIHRIAWRVCKGRSLLFTLHGICLYYATRRVLQPGNLVLKGRHLWAYARVVFDPLVTVGPLTGDAMSTILQTQLK